MVSPVSPVSPKISVCSPHNVAFCISRRAPRTDRSSWHEMNAEIVHMYNKSDQNCGFEWFKECQYSRKPRYVYFT